MMAGDVLALMDHLAIARSDIMGYSLGGRITAFLARHHAERVRRAILGGIGIGLIAGGGPGENVAQRSRRRRSTASPTGWGGCSAPLPIRRARTAGRWPPACAARGG